MSAAKYLSTIDPALFYEAVTASDTVNFTGPINTSPGPGGDILANAIYVGVAGDVVAVRDDDVAITFTAAPAGMVIPVKCKRINSTSTTATNMVALF